MNRKKVEHWLKKNRSLLNYSAIERETKLVRGVLQKFLKYDKKLNDTSIKTLSDLIEHKLRTKWLNIKK